MKVSARKRNTERRLSCPSSRDLLLSIRSNTACYYREGTRRGTSENETHKESKSERRQTSSKNKRGIHRERKTQRKIHRKRRQDTKRERHRERKRQNRGEAQPEPVLTTLSFQLVPLDEFQSRPNLSGAVARGQRHDGAADTPNTAATTRQRGVVSRAPEYKRVGKTILILQPRGWQARGCQRLTYSRALFSSFRAQRNHAHAALQHRVEQSQAHIAALESELNQAADECQQLQNELRDTQVRAPFFRRIALSPKSTLAQSLSLTRAP